MLRKYFLFMEILKLINICQYLQIFIFVILVNIYIFVDNLLKWIKEREKHNDILNSQVLLITDHARHFLMQNHVISNNLSDILNYLPTGALTFHWQISRKRSTVFNNYKMSICDQVHLEKFWHMWRTWKILKKISIQIYQFWNFYCDTVKSFVRPKICKTFKFCMDGLLQIATKEKFCEANFREQKSFISLIFSNKLRLPTWIFDVMYQFDW